MTEPGAHGDSRGREVLAMARAVRRACLEAAVTAAEDAGFAGLCADGRLNRALDAIRALDVELILSRAARDDAAE